MLTPSLLRTPIASIRSGLLNDQWRKFFEDMWRSPLSGLLVNIPTKLTKNDKGKRYEATDYDHVFEWTGTAWRYAHGERPGGEFAFFRSDPGLGWALCDGSTVNMSTSAAGVVSVVLPDLEGVMLEGALSYSGPGITAAVAPAISGTTSSDSAGTPSGTISDVSLTSSSSFGAGALAAVTGPSSQTPTFTGSALAPHSHGLGTLSVNSAGRPPRVGVPVYMRL